ncbi:DUF1330 domain-containing protein [Pacificoceanicola onchidii]|uniref:DUF1330 domain-containing protein n=1 Tax=Pacificoceanicola onchidii TaxID=2562685 RepID=UPI001455DED9|nr:DUF1330 domain-containing protein [Pacificoceanicola onchidii]
MTVTVLAMVTVNEANPSALARYFEVTQPLMERAKAKIVQRFDVSKAVVGGKPAETIILVEYPDHDAVASVFQSPEYEAVKPIRDEAFSRYSVSVVGEA